MPALRGAAVPEGLAGLVHERSEGNPLFMVAVLDDLTERGLLARATGRWQLRVPLEVSMASGRSWAEAQH